MKRTVIAVAAVAAALTVAGTGVAASAVWRETVVIEVGGSVEDGCSEPILLTSGKVVDTVQEFDDGNGRTHFLFHFQTHGLVGVGLESGATYTDASHMTATGISSVEEGFGNTSISLHVRISSKDGDVADLTVSQRFHLVKRDGDRQLLIDSFVAECA